MIKPRTLDQLPDPDRPTLPRPRNPVPFNGWGPRIIY
jgi:hypothetical protein